MSGDELSDGVAPWKSELDAMAERQSAEMDVRVARHRLPPEEPVTFLDASQVAAEDAEFLRRLAGTNLSASGVVLLPSGTAMTGAEVRRWREDRH